MWLYIFIGFTLQFKIFCSAQDSDDNKNSRVQNGTVAEKNEFPWAVYLEFPEDIICTGSLISDRLVLTAAHCAYDDNDALYSPEKLSGRVGTVKVDGGTKMKFESLIPHPKYKKGKPDFDLAIFKIKGKVELTTNVQTICLISSTKESYDNLTTLGYGQTENGPTKKLRETTLRILKPEERNNCTNSEVLCAVGDKTAIGTGDSGGLLVSKTKGDQYVQVGVTSALLHEDKLLNLFPRVAAAAEFIKEQEGDGSKVCFK